MDELETLVSFEHGAGFFYRRALRRWQENDCESALSLFRQALRVDPGLASCRQDMVRLLIDMGRTDVAARALCRDFSGTPEEYLALGLALRALNNLEGAQTAFLACIRDAAEDGLREQAVLELMGVRGAIFETESGDRSFARARRLKRCALRQVHEQRFASAARNAKRAQARLPEGETRLLRAYALARDGKKGAAIRLSLPMALNDALDNSLRMKAVRVLMAARAAGQAQQALLRILRRPLAPEEALRLLPFASLLPIRPLSKALYSLLRAYPYNRSLLHACAACVLKTGRPAEEAAACWQRMLAVDPDDPVAAAYLRAYLDETLERDVVPFEPRLTPKMRRQTLERLELAGEASKEEQLALCRWALTDSACAVRAVGLLDRMSGQGAEALLRETLADPDQAASIRMLATDALERRGASSPRPICTRDALILNNPLTVGPVPEVPIVCYRVLKTAARTLVSFQDGVVEPLMKLWSEWIDCMGGQKRLPVDVTAAALTLLAAARSEIPLAEEEIAWRFGCSKRKLNRYVRRINNQLERNQRNEQMH